MHTDLNANNAKPPRDAKLITPPCLPHTSRLQRLVLLNIENELLADS
ncbi:MAG TPA: hypothetical protein VNR87_02685 [Flavisolibacter sp.]|nr:hypothetical protein [Flavisolibacter sp.]